MPQKSYLFTPGPTPVPPEVLAAMGEPVVHHRSPDFRPIYERCLARLREVSRTERDVLLFTASGTGAFESAVANLVSPGEPHLVVSAGNFGERWATLVRAYGAEVDHLRYAWGETPDPDDVRSRLRARAAKAVWIVHSETSTGVVSDVQALAAAARESGALVVVDAVSSLGAVPCETDAWGLDVVVSGSQKALMTPPGLGTCAVSEAAYAATGTSPRFYFDWERTRAAQAKLDAAFTPPVSLVAALDVALGLLLEEGLDAVFERHIRLGRAARAGAKAMGLELFSPDEDRSAVVTAVRTPDGIDATELVKGLRDRFGMTIANGQGDLLGKIFRLGHIGWFDVFDIATMLAAVEIVLADLGADVERGVAVTAALEAYEHTRVGVTLRVLVREAIAPAGVDLLRERFDVDEDGDSDLAEIIDRYDAIVVRSATKLTADLIERAIASEGDRPRGRRRRQRGRRSCDAARDRGRERAGVDGRLRGGAHDRAARRARAQHPAGARGAEAGPLGAEGVRRHRARREDARRARLRPHRPAGRAARRRARDARRRLRPVRLGRALSRARRRARRDDRGGATPRRSS